MVSFDNGRRCGGISIVEQEVSMQTTANAGKALAARSTNLPRNTQLMKTVPQASADHQ